MKENAPTPLPAYLTGKQFTSRLSETEHKQLAEFVKEFCPDGKPPETSRQFLNFLLSVGAGLQSKQAGANTEDVTELKTENKRYKHVYNENQALISNLIKEVNELNTEIENLKKENERLQAEFKNTPPEQIGFEIFEDERLAGLRSFRKAEHQHPFDTIQFHHEEAVKSIRDYEFAKAEIEGQPLKVLDGEEYEAFKKWDEEVLTPALHALTGIPEQWEEKVIAGETKRIRIPVFLPRHKFIMMWDYCQADPIQGVMQLFPTATDAQKRLFEDMQFPRASIVAQVLKDIEEIRSLTESTTDANTTEPVQTQTEGAKVIALNPTAGTENANPAADSQNGNKPAE